MKRERFLYGKMTKEGVVDASIEEFSAMMGDPSLRIVGKTDIPGTEITVSTVFLGINHGFGKKDLWFETMIFGFPLEGEQYQERYETKEEAIEGHVRAVRYAVKKTMSLRYRFRQTLRRVTQWFRGFYVKREADEG